MRLAFILVIVAALALVLWLALDRRSDAWVDPDGERAATSARVALDEVIDEDAHAAERLDAAPDVEPAVPARMLRPDDPMSLLRVRVIDVATRKPVSEAHVTFRTFGTLPPKSPGGRPEDEAFPTSTCGEGLAVRMIQPGARWEVIVAPELGRPARVAAEPLIASEERHLLVEVDTSADCVFHGRVLARETNLPITGAVVQLEPKHDRVAVSADGAFHAEMRSWRDHGLEVRAPGYGPRWVPRGPGHETPDRALEILLDRGASLRVEVLDSSGKPVDRVTVEVAASRRDLSSEPSSSAANFGESRWEVTSGIDGIAEWLELPAGTPLVGKVRRHGTLLHQVAEPIELAAGEQRALTWRLAATSEISGVVLDAGTPVPGQIVWLQPSQGEREPILRSGLGAERRQASADASGRFRFRHVTPGSWWLSPAEPDFGKTDPTRDPIALGQLVDVPAQGTTIEVDVNLQRGLVIRGRILSPDDSALVGGSVSAKRDGVQQWVHAIANAEGEFVIGPLLPGAWKVSAQDRVHLQSAPIQVDAGSTNVELRLRHCAGLQVRVLDSAGLPVPSVHVVVVPERWYALTGETDPTGMASVRRIPLGPVSVGCTLPDGRWGFVAGVPVELGHANAVDLALQPGARGTIRLLEGESPAHVSILRDGAMLGSANLMQGQTSAVTLPTGRVTLRLYTGRKFRGDHEVVIAAGTTPEFTFDGAWR